MKKVKSKSTNKHTKKQVVVIHGGNTFDTRKEYLDYLATRSVGEENFKQRRDWKDSLEKRIGTFCDVFFPKMPNGTSAHYEEWKIWFERMLPFLRGDIVLVGHSLGGIFLAKYLSENKIRKKVKGLVLVAAPFDDTDSSESLGDFRFKGSLDGVARQVRQVHIIHSEDDPVVSFVQAFKYKNALPSAHMMCFSDRGHFNMDEFPEMVRLLRSLLG